MKSFFKIIYWNSCSIEKRNQILCRPISSDSAIIKNKVNTIITDVKNLGDQALYNYTNIFDHIKLNTIQVSAKDIEDSELYVTEEIKNALKIAISNIKKFHIAQKTPKINLNINNDVHCQHIVRPIESVGLYIPSGSAPLVSTVLMLAIPARIAGCKKIIMCSPPPIANEVLYAGKLCGIKEIFQVGGAQAIAALGFGTKTVPRVDKIFGPGNAYVTEAKLQISNILYNVGIDMPAGPSEVLIIADSNANASFIASDLLSQAEHDSRSQVLLITYDVNLAKKVLIEIQKQIKTLLRYSIIAKVLKHSKVIVAKDLLECFTISNLYAPEHLMIQCCHSQNLIKYVVNAGSIFLGSWSPVAGGDYAVGTNHVLPTYGSANVYSGLSLVDFQKRMTVQKLSKIGLKNISNAIISLSKLEKLDAHKNSVMIRLSSLSDIV
ncbi:MAG: histidinol dehydrogenase [Buchnera aphidicola (Kaburagia rhusicola ensigallis)]